MVYLLLSFIRATRTTDWILHLSTVRAMLPWYFAYDPINYARYMSTYWLEMICLDDTHPGKVMNVNMFHICTVSALSKSVKCLLYTCSATKFDANAIEQFFLVFQRCIAELSWKWTVQRQQKYGFSSIASDQAIEQTCNRDSKTKGGIVGLTQNRAAIHRWILAQADRSAITRKCELMAGVADEQRYLKTILNRYTIKIHFKNCIN